MKAIVFPGQGAQKIGMGKDFYKNYPKAKEVFDKASEAAGLDIAKLCFEEEEKINQTEYTQVALVTCELAIMAVLADMGLSADVTAGLSLGEYSSLVLAGSMDISKAAKLVRHRGIYMQEAVPAGRGGMAAILGMDPADIEKVMEGCENAWIANYNSDAQTVITGYKEAVDEAAAKLKEAGAKRVVPLVVSGPFHSPLMNPASEKLAADLEKVEILKPVIPYVANVNGEYVDSAEPVKELLTKQVASSVRWNQSVKAMVAAGVDTFIEVGPGKTLTKLISKIAPAAKTINVATVEDLESVKELI
jgi:[acyl-carrier-protein] S-malonyltransferase